jgi:hypothetical protein
MTTRRVLGSPYTCVSAIAPHWHADQAADFAIEPSGPNAHNPRTTFSCRPKAWLRRATTCNSDMGTGVLTCREVSSRTTLDQRRGRSGLVVVVRLPY